MKNEMFREWKDYNIRLKQQCEQQQNIRSQVINTIIEVRKRQFFNKWKRVQIMISNRQKSVEVALTKILQKSDKSLYTSFAKLKYNHFKCQKLERLFKILIVKDISSAFSRLKINAKCKALLEQTT